ncbi:MAG: DUF484 family protein [Gammaproteobacteria bacterium]|nr:MAG: DUF484 family protein [Gammaproteobacteria bacterium]
MTEKENPAKNVSTQPDEESVADFLRSNPDFFEKHPDILESIQIPHDSGDAASLIEYQVRLLREQNHQLRRKLQGLVNVARQNEDLVQKLYEFSLSIMDAGDLQALVQIIDEGLQRDFEADAVSVTLFTEQIPENLGKNVRAVKRDDESLEPFKAFLAEPNAMCGRFQPKKLEVLFGSRGEKVESAALIPLGESCEYGMLAIGSFEPDKFNPGMDTSFLKLMGQLFSRAFSRYLHSVPGRHAQGEE